MTPSPSDGGAPKVAPNPGHGAVTSGVEAIDLERFVASLGVNRGAANRSLMQTPSW